MAQEIILEKQLFDGFEYNSDHDAFRYGGEAMIPATYVLEPGQDYIVVWDEEEWPRTAFAFTVEDALCVGIGNTLAIGGEDSYEPFCIVYDSTNSQLHYFSTETDTSHIIAIYQEVIENVVIRNPKGIPITYGEYDNILLTSSTGEKINYSKLPEVTTNDDGKVLGVVNGFWNKMDVKIVSSWNDLTDRPGGYVEFLPEVIYTYDGNLENYKYYVMTSTNNYMLTLVRVGDTVDSVRLIGAAIIYTMDGE